MRNSGKSCRDSDLTHLRLSTRLSRLALRLAGTTTEWLFDI